MMQLEICASTPVDVAIALEAGADRVELCTHWECGGLTPTPAMVRASVALKIPVRALIRPRAGHFVYNASEKSIILSEALDSLEAGAEKVVAGGLTPDGFIDRELLELLTEKVGGEHLVWHRALDLSIDPIASAEELLAFGVEEVLTSGGAPAAGLGLDLIREFSTLGLSVIAGGGVRAEDVVNLGEAGVSVTHASCRSVEKLEISTPSSELFDLHTNPVDFSKVEHLSLAVENWNNTSDEE